MGNAFQPVVRHTVNEDQFPFTIQAFDEDTGELLWHQLIEKPGEVYVPGWAPRKVAIKISHPDGSVTTVGSDDKKTNQS